MTVLAVLAVLESTLHSFLGPSLRWRTWGEGHQSAIFCEKSAVSSENLRLSAPSKSLNFQEKGRKSVVFCENLRFGLSLSPPLKLAVTLVCPSKRIDILRFPRGLNLEKRLSRLKVFGGSQKGGFQKGWFRRMFPRNENRNEGTFGCSPGTKTGTRVRSHVPPERQTGTRVYSPNHPFTKPPFCLLSNFNLASELQSPLKFSRNTS